MAETSHIEWTDATWNPVTGCSVVSPGCTHCYAMKLAGTRLKHHPSRAGLTRDTKAGPVWTGEVRLNEQWLDQPLRWTRPRMIFPCAHGDLFHESVPDEWIDRVFAVMALSPQHTYQVLTKRSARMRDYMADLFGDGRAFERVTDRMIGDPIFSSVPSVRETCEAYGLPWKMPTCAQDWWPLPNVWLGVSAERQQEADARIPDLLATPAAVRFVSLEPLLGEMDIRAYLGAATGGASLALSPSTSAPAAPRLSWVIVGGESGPDARPMHPHWARALRDQCAAAGVPFFFKQWGSWLGGEGEDMGDSVYFSAASSERESRLLQNSHRFDWFDADRAPNGPMHLHVGKKAAGRRLDGVEHNAMPERWT